ncbi:MAG: hypothetical protein WC707_04965 [Candidatus Babeliaceae bacterium]|jgi:hypothetical protein
MKMRMLVLMTLCSVGSGLAVEESKKDFMSMMEDTMLPGVSMALHYSKMEIKPYWTDAEELLHLKQKACIFLASLSMDDRGRKIIKKCEELNQQREKENERLIILAETRMRANAEKALASKGLFARVWSRIAPW